MPVKKSRPVLFLAALTVLALVVLVFRLLPSATPETAQVVLPEAASPEISGAGSVRAAEGRVLTVGPDTVKPVLAALNRPESYSRTLTSELFSSEGRSSGTVDAYVSGGNVRLAINEAEETKNVLILGDWKWVWDEDSGEVFSGPAEDGDEDRYQGLLRYEEIAWLPQENILDADYESYGGEGCVMVRYTAGEPGYFYRIWISTQSGLLMGSETYDTDGQTLIMRVRSSKPDLSPQTDSLFIPPDG